MKLPEVSIIMLTYNREQFLERSIEAVLNQKKCDFELVIVNNGSTDNSKDICELYAQRDDRIRVINKAYGNIGSGRNAGIKASRGKYISFVDDDDYLEDDMFAFLCDHLIQHEADISICGCYSDFGDRLEVYYVYDEIFLLDRHQGVEELLKRKIYNSANPCKLFKKDLFNNVRYPENGKYDDIHTIYKLFANSNRVVATGIPKYYFTKHQENNSSFIITNQLTREMLNEYLDAFKERTNYLSSLLPDLEGLCKYSELSYMISMIDKIDQHQIRDCLEIRNEMKMKIERDKKLFINSKYLTERDVFLIEKYL